MQTVDVLVVGAGPAGAAAARRCSQAGLRTLLVDKHRLPRRKACSGILTNASQNYLLEHFGPLPRKVFSRPYLSRGMGFYFPSVGMVYTDVDCYNLYVWRDKFDHFLARSSGARLRDETRFLHLEEEEGRIVAHLERKGKATQVRARYLIGADGANSRVIRSFAPEVYRGMPWAYACQKYFEGKVDVDDRYLHWFLTPGFGPFPWVNVKDDQIVIGLATVKGQNFHARFSGFTEFLKRKLGLQLRREIAMEACPSNTMTPLNRFFPGRGRVLMVGDAMGLMHQGGEGISCALASGGHAGEAVVQALRRGTDALGLYKRLVRPEMETALDQFNPLRMRASSASPASRQPGLLHGLGPVEKAKALRDTARFLRSEFHVEGMGEAVLKNTLHRLVFRRYHIPAAD